MDDARPQPREYALIAPPLDQRRLLDLQGIDTRLGQIAYRCAHLPELAELANLQEQGRELADRVVAAETLESDIRRELLKAEADVAQVRVRSDRDRVRLDAGQGSTKELTALQAELESLTRRQAVLEDIELEIMERHEQSSAAASVLQAQRTELASEIATVEKRRDAALAELTGEQGELLATRSDLLRSLDTALVTLYDKIRGNSDGIGAAMLRARRCEGCRMELNPQELQNIRAAAAEAIVRCEDCARILIRTDESGL